MALAPGSARNNNLEPCVGSSQRLNSCSAEVCGAWPPSYSFDVVVGCKTRVLHSDRTVALERPVVSISIVLPRANQVSTAESINKASAGAEICSKASVAAQPFAALVKERDSRADQPSASGRAGARP